MLSPMLVKIEVRSEEVHLILNAELVFAAEHAELALSALQTRLGSDERLLIEPGTRKQLRVCIKRRLSFRGGRSWLIEGNAVAVARPALDPVLVDGLKSAHAIFTTAGLDPNARKFGRGSKSPAHPYQRKLCLLAVLAPELQVAIVEGRIPRNVTLHDLISGAPMPLLWREQKDWLFRRTANSNAPEVRTVGE
jgi:hypothetical protein